MDDFLRSLLLVLCGLVALIALAVTYLWYFVFGKSLRAVLMAGLSIMMNRDSKIDIDDDPKLAKRPKDAKGEITQEVEALDFTTSITTHDEYIPQMKTSDTDSFGAQSVDQRRQTQELVSSSFEEGRFRRITDVLSRPFLKMRMMMQSDIPAENVKRGGDSSNIE